MALKMQNPGVQAGASRDQLGVWSHLSPTALGRCWQLIASRYRLSPSPAPLVAAPCIGEAYYD